jgi:L-amino acid N-acyltransferase
MKVVACTYDDHAEQILEILNDAIVNSTALYDYKPRSLDSMNSWFKSKDDGQFPVIGVEGDRGELLGFATYGVFRAWPAYKYSVEHSVYVHKEHRSKGFGRSLLQRLIGEAQSQQYHVMIGGIDLANIRSIELHKNLGFTHAGTITQVGYKFGRWLDLAFYQLILQTPSNPSDA